MPAITVGVGEVLGAGSLVSASYQVLDGATGERISTAWLSSTVSRALRPLASSVAPVAHEHGVVGEIEQTGLLGQHLQTGELVLEDADQAGALAPAAFDVAQHLVALRGATSDLYLALWRRVPLGDLTTFGDGTVATALLDAVQVT